MDDFLVHLIDVQALAAAFECGLIDRLAAAPGCKIEALQEVFGGEPRGLQLLLDLLRTNRVAREGEGWELTAEFRKALQYRDLLEAKIDFANIAAPDLIHHFPALLRNPNEFMRKADMFGLFAYGRCFDSTPENLALARRWMRITTALTRYEARVCLQRHDFSTHRRMMDFGGNSGEFVLRLCQQRRELHATVFDLPVVCDVGRQHVLFEEEAERIQFVKGNALTDPLPTGFDLITFKSVLHDWPDREATDFVERASRSLLPRRAAAHLRARQLRFFARHAALLRAAVSHFRALLPRAFRLCGAAGGAGFPGHHRAAIPARNAVLSCHRREARAGRANAMPTVSIKEAFEAGLQYHRAGRLAEAEHIYRQILEHEPNDPDGYFLLGCIAQDRHQHPEAADLIRRAVTLNPAVPEYYLRLAQVFGALGDQRSPRIVPP